MRVKRTTGALQPREQSARQFPVKRHKRSIFRTVLSGAAAVGLGLALMTGTAAQPTWADDVAQSGQAVQNDNGTATYTVTVPTDKAKSADGGVKVTVTDKDSTLPEGATLQASLIQDEKDVDAVASELDKAEVSYDGFLALDIHFVDKDGNEVEPSGAVDVKLELPQATLGDDVDADSLSVQHLAEDENGNVEKVDAVADAGDATQGTVEATDDKATADFTVDSFSTFTITWDALLVDTDVTVNCYFYDENGKTQPIENGKIPGLNQSVMAGQSVSFDESDSNLAIDGYTFDKAKYLFGYQDSSEKDLTSIEIGRTGSMMNRRWYVKFNGGQELDLDDKPVTINLYYTKNSGGGDEGGTTPGGGTNATVQTGKTAVLRDDGNYDLTLSISGDRGSATSPALVDVLFIVDRSDSMNDYNRLTNTKNAMKTLVSSLEGNTNINARYSIVTFSGPSRTGDSNGKKDASVHMGWTAVSGNNVSNSIDGITASGGTDYQAGLDVGTDQLNSTRQGATKVVIFLSDGEPTWSYNYGKGNSALGTNSAGWGETLQQAQKISCDYFYAIGIGSSSNSYLNGLVNSVHATTKQRIEAKNDGSNLTNLFNDIAGEVTFFAAQNVMITDPLSQYADLVLTNGAPQFTVSVTNGTQTWSDTVAPGGSLTFYDKDGKAQTATPRVSDDNRTIYLDLPASYQLEEGYTYSISTVITPNSEATSYYSSHSNSYPTGMTGGENTGTHSGDSGFWSNDNDNAKVTYTANGESGSENFPKPVIQVQTKTLTVSNLLTVNKIVHNHDLAADQFDFTVTPIEGTNTTAQNAADLAGISVDGEPFSNVNGADAEQSGLARRCNTLTFNSTMVGNTYAFRYEEEQKLDQNYQGTDQASDYTFDPSVYQVELTPELTDDGSALQVTMNIYKLSGSEKGDPIKTVVYTEGSTEAGSITFNNTYNSLGLRITKTNVDGDKLPGAYFAVYDSLADDVEPLDTIYSSTTLGDQNKQGTDGFKTGSDGVVTFYNLQRDQTYYVKEVSMPSGYKANTNIYKIVIDPSGTATLTKLDAEGNQVSSPETMRTEQDANTIYTMSLENTQVTEIPHTGSAGTVAVSAAGVAVASVAGYALYRKRYPQR